MKGSLKIGLIAFFVMLAKTGYSHGEDKLGPHKGLIRMPGGFHTEVLSDGKSGFKVYLLDLGWENPTSQESSVILTLAAKNKLLQTVTCSSRKDFFICPLKPDIKIKDAVKLELEAIRMGVKGTKAEYDLPLKLQYNESSDSKQ